MLAGAYWKLPQPLLFHSGEPGFEVEIQYEETTEKSPSSRTPPPSSEKATAPAMPAPRFDVQSSLEAYSASTLQQNGTPGPRNEAPASPPLVFGSEGSAHKTQGRMADLRESMELQPSLQLIYNHIEAHLEYPDELVDDGVEGFAAIHFEVDRDGSLTAIEDEPQNQSRVRGYVLKVILDSMKPFRLPKDHFLDEPTLITAQFAFFLHAPDSSAGGLLRDS